MSNVENNIPKIPIDYVTNDYKGFFEMMKEAIPILTPEWTDTSDSDQGIIILQLLAYGLNTLSYYQERTMQENILELARTKRGILAGCNYLGYTPSRQTASVAMLTITKDSDYLGTEQIVPTGTKFSTDPSLGSPIIFETMEPLIIPEGELSGTVLIKQGETTENQLVGVSNGKSTQTFTVPESDVLVDTLYVYTIENGTIREWIKVDNFLSSNASDRHYTVSLDEENRTTITFGDGVFGRIPPLEMQMSATYRVGGGVMGNLAPGLISYVYDTNSSLSFIEEVTNEEWSSGGLDYEDLNRAKILAPKHYRSREQAVTPMDFEDIAELVPGIVRAKCEETFTSSKVYVHCLAEGYTVPTQALTQAVKDKLDSNRIGNVDLEVKPCTITNFDIEMTVYIHEKFDGDLVAHDVDTQLRDYFDIEYFDFATEFFKAKVIDIVFNTPGVRNVVLNDTVTKDIINVAPYEVLKLNNVTISIGGI